MGRPSEVQRRFANLFVSGPSAIRGRWEECSVAAGMVEPPLLETKVLRTLIEKLGGTPPPLPDASLAAALALADARREERGEPTPDVDALDPVAALAAAAELGLPWAEMRDSLQTVIQSIAKGTVKASTAQVAMLKYIVEQAKETALGQEASLGVVLLPVQGAGATMQLDPVQRKKAMETLNAET